MTRAELNHLRRLVAWVRCEYMQTPEEFVATAQGLMARGYQPDEEGKKRLVAHHDELRKVPKYVHAAVKSLGKYVNEAGAVTDAKPTIKALA